MWGGFEILRHRTGILCKSCQTILWLKQIHVSFKSRQNNSRWRFVAGKKILPVVKSTELDCTKPPGLTNNVLKKTQEIAFPRPQIFKNSLGMHAPRPSLFGASTFLPLVRTPSKFHATPLFYLKVMCINVYIQCSSLKFLRNGSVVPMQITWKQFMLYINS